ITDDTHVDAGPLFLLRSFVDALVFLPAYFRVVTLHVLNHFGSVVIGITDEVKRLTVPGIIFGISFRRHFILGQQSIRGNHIPPGGGSVLLAAKRYLRLCSLSGSIPTRSSEVV